MTTAGRRRPMARVFWYVLLEVPMRRPSQSIPAPAPTAARRWAPAVALAALALTASALLMPAESADAQRRRRGRSRVAAYVVQGRVPDVSSAQVVRWARGHQARRLRETTSQPIPERRWNAKLITDFGRAIGDMQFDAAFYEVSGPRHFLESREFHINDRSQSVFVNRLRLERPTFQPNMEIEVVITRHRREVARTRFELAGAVVRPQGTGEVDFTQENAP